jgi:hypothetical protein
LAINFMYILLFKMLFFFLVYRYYMCWW